MVFQFATATTEDGDEDASVFHSDDQVHVHALEKLFAMAMFFIEKWFPSGRRLFPRAKQSTSKFHNFVEFKKLMQPNQWEKEMESYAVGWGYHGAVGKGNWGGLLAMGQGEKEMAMLCYCGRGAMGEKEMAVLCYCGRAPRRGALLSTPIPPHPRG